jgi:heme/copper-type cytochrome/quinol oxidase subunit 1
MRRALPWSTAALAVALLVAGVVLFATTDPARPADFGWYAYQPLPAESSGPYSSTLTLTFDDGSVLWSDGQLLGAGLVVAGLLLLAVLAGWAVGRRAPRPPQQR